jgi:DNA-binding response OmpR family regulator
MANEQINLPGKGRVFGVTAARPILVIESDPAQGRILAESVGLSNEFTISVTATLDEADALLGAVDARFDAIIIDPDVAEGNGHGYLAKLRQQGHKMPIIVVTKSGEEADVVRVLNAGAVDYLTKPLRLNELLARLRAQLRVFDASEHATFVIGQYTFRPAAKLLTDQAGRRLRLTNKEVGILKFLYSAGEKVVARSTLLDGVWGYNPGTTTHTLETHIYRLRRKIEADPASCQMLVTDQGGYRLNIAIAA